MAQDLVINGKIVIDDSQASAPVKSIKAQLKEANAELIQMSEKFGETSVEAVNAAKKVADLKDRIGDAKALTEAFSPDKKFQAFSAALSGVAGGFAAVQGAQALFGTESKELEKTLVKVQSAMALSQGLSAVTESIDAFKNLGTVMKSIPIIQKAITAAQWLWNAAMDANPVGAIIIAITALIAGIVALTKYFMDNAEAAKAQAKEVENSAKAIEKQKNALKENAEVLDRNQKFQLDYAKASGKSAEEIRKLEIALINKKIAEKEAASVTALATVQLEKNRLATLKAADANDDVIKAQEENLKSARENLKNANDDVISAGKERQDIVNRQAIDRRQEQTNADNKERQDAKAQSDKLKQQKEKDAEDRKNAEKDLQKQLADIKYANYLQSIKDDQERAEEKLRIDYENQKKSIENSIASEQTKNALLSELGKKYWMDLAAIEDEAAAKKKEKFQAEVDAMYNDTLADLDRQIEAEKQASEAKKKIAEDEAKAKIELYQGVGSAFGALSELIGKQTAAGKALAIAQATINTWLGVTEVLRAKSVLPEPVGTIAKAVNIAAIVASGISAVRNIVKTPVPNSSGSGGSGSISAPPLTGAAAPLQPQLSTTMMNQAQINQLSSATTRAFVLESDVTNNQERIIRLNRAARIN